MSLHGQVSWCSLCKVQPCLQSANFFSVIFHKLSGYDSDLFSAKLGKSEGKIKCTPKKQRKLHQLQQRSGCWQIHRQRKKKKIQKDTRFDSNLSLSFDKLLSNLSHDKLKEDMKVFEKDKIDIFTRTGV